MPKNEFKTKRKICFKPFSTVAAVTNVYVIREALLLHLPLFVVSSDHTHTLGASSGKFQLAIALNATATAIRLLLFSFNQFF